MYLATKGYKVTAGDLVPYNVELIEKQNKKTPLLQRIYTDNILALSMFEDNNFDVVLCLGAFYHLHNKRVFLPKLTNINFMIEFVASYLADKFMLRCFFEDVLHIELEKRYRKRTPEYRNYAEIFYDYIESAFS